MLFSINSLSLFFLALQKPLVTRPESPSDRRAAHLSADLPNCVEKTPAHWWVKRKAQSDNQCRCNAALSNSNPASFMQTLKQQIRPLRRIAQFITRAVHLKIKSHQLNHMLQGHCSSKKECWKLQIGAGDSAKSWETVAYRSAQFVSRCLLI